TFDAAVVPEATPSPRTIRFATPPLHDGVARNYDSAEAAAADAHVAGIFGEFDAVTNVLVGPDFVAVTIARPDRWEELLEPILRAVTRELVAAAGARAESTSETQAPARADVRDDATRETRRIERAWGGHGGSRTLQHGNGDILL